MRRAPADALRALAGMAIAASPPRLSTHPGRFLAVLRPPSRSSLTSNPHSAAAQPGPNFPRLRALALFGRLTAERVEARLPPTRRRRREAASVRVAKSLVIASVQKPAQKKITEYRAMGGEAALARKRREDRLRVREGCTRLVVPAT